VGEEEPDAWRPSWTSRALAVASRSPGSILVCRYGAGSKLSREIVTSLGRGYPDLVLRTRIDPITAIRE
jgi:hypothetical protein